MHNLDVACDFQSGDILTSEDSDDLCSLLLSIDSPYDDWSVV